MPSLPAQDLAPTPTPTPVPDTEAVRAARLWEAIRRTREALERKERRVRDVTERFDTTIRPREERLTHAVCRLTERLVDHHERTALDHAERTLLGLWIDENLSSLSSHPFASRTETAALRRHWCGQRHANGRARTSVRDGARDGEPIDGEDGKRDGDGARDDSPRGAHAHAREAAEGIGTDTDRDRLTTLDRDMRALSARLFRRLARTLHPDREQDEARKLVKHGLMSDCLRAREEHDVDTLLRLYTTHVGALPDALTDGGVTDGGTLALERLLRTQLRALRRRLDQCDSGDALRALIMARYASADSTENERRLTEHARALDGETSRIEALRDRVSAPDGLRHALGERREIELDRLWIDEATGLSNG